MKQIRFLRILLTCFALFASTIVEARLIERTFTVKNKSVSKVRVAYCYGVSEKDIRPGKSAGYHIRGWEYVDPGHSKLFKMNTPYRNFFVYVQRADGAEYVVKREPSRFYIQPEGENFQVIQRFGDGRVLHHTGDLSRLQKVTFYKYEDRRTFMIPGPLAINKNRFDGDHDMQKFIEQGKDYARLLAINTHKHLEAALKKMHALWDDKITELVVLDLRKF